MNPSSVRAWIRKYKTFALEEPITKNKNTFYISDIKLQAVNDFINGKGS
ncbi:hypothetical protein [Clostridium weizhouense]|uniref:Transposase n=1 Tax=Clostridium weizhouense TaxID=2859781 RepID=A0ABS7AV27_9CLOT|nr:hypothetical protein [Clostridium weizhouense]MBW6411645.1 hypothetical protein [Clostridium weizhouense]